jgi:hypothetical protein
MMIEKYQMLEIFGGDFMEKDKKKKDYGGCTTINAKDPGEINYWCGKLCCTQQQLTEALKDEGNSVDKIKKRFKKD